MSSGRSEGPAATSLTDLPPGAATVADRYVRVRELGAGGMGSVFLARDLQTGGSVALKRLTRIDAKSVLRFKREFRSLAHIQHRNLVRLYESEREPDGMWFLTMEYVPGSVAYLHGDRERALKVYSESAEILAALGMVPDALRDRCAVGLLTGGAEGAQIADETFDALEQRMGCADARRYMRAYLPELLGSVGI